MFARVIDIKTKPGEAAKLCHTLHDKILGMLKSQPGFVDELVLVNEAEEDHVLAVSLWKTLEDAENYRKVNYPKIKELIEHHIHHAPTVHMYAVDSSTVHKIAKGKAV